MTRSEILEILKKYKDENAEKYGINNLGLFGSYSKDEEREELIKLLGYCTIY